MKLTTLLIHLVVFVLGALARLTLEPLVAPVIGPASLGPFASTALALVLGCGLVHYLSADKLQRLQALWAAPTPTLWMLGLMLLGFTGTLYAASVVTLEATTPLANALRAAAGWALLLNLAAAVTSSVVTLRALGMRHSAAL